MSVYDFNGCLHAGDPMTVREDGVETAWRVRSVVTVGKTVTVNLERKE